jgi:hypothetical protein
MSRRELVRIGVVAKIVLSRPEKVLHRLAVTKGLIR